jgi:4-amino-4-deoxy-L-arabinose transferase-like glycosyltransferase
MSTPRVEKRSRTRYTPAMSARPESASFRAYVIVLLIGLVIVGSGFATHDVWDDRESAYLLGARSMTTGKALVAPVLGDASLAPHPLTYWSVAATSTLFGDNELGVRLGSLLVALASLFALTYCMTRLRGAAVGMLSGLVLATMPQFYLSAQSATPDAWIAGGVGVGLLFMYLAWTQPGRSQRWRVRIGLACFCVAALAGGWIHLSGVVTATFLLGLLSGAEERTRIRGMLREYGVELLVCVVVSALPSVMYGWQTRTVSGAFAELESSGRYSAYYIGPLIYGTFPWSFLVPASLLATVNWRSRTPLKRYGLELLLIVSSLSGCAIATLTEGNWRSQTISVLVPMAVLVAILMDRLCRARAASARLAWIAVAALTAAISIELSRDGGLVQLLSSVMSEPDFAAFTPLGLAVTAILLGIPSLMLISALFGGRLAPRILAASAVALALIVSALLMLLPAAFRITHLYSYS